jgi:TorA-specific chaperone
MLSQETPGLSHYACLYAWLSGCFARELSDEQIAGLAGPEFTPWLTMLGKVPKLAAQVNQLAEAITALQQRPDARLELAADFAGLFLMTGKAAALPYASCYQADSSRFKQQQSVEMKAMLAQSGLTVSGTFAEPEDHLALSLELLSRLSFALTEEETPREALLALRSEVINSLSWLTEFNQRCARFDGFGFYAALSALLLALLEVDADTLFPKNYKTLD